MIQLPASGHTSPPYGREVSALCLQWSSLLGGLGLYERLEVSPLDVRGTQYPCSESLVEQNRHSVSAEKQGLLWISLHSDNGEPSIHFSLQSFPCVQQTSSFLLATASKTFKAFKISLILVVGLFFFPESLWKHKILKPGRDLGERMHYLIYIFNSPSSATWGRCVYKSGSLCSLIGSHSQPTPPPAPPRPPCTEFQTYIAPGCHPERPARVAGLGVHLTLGASPLSQRPQVGLGVCCAVYYCVPTASRFLWLRPVRPPFQTHLSRKGCSWGPREHCLLM